MIISALIYQRHRKEADEKQNRTKFRRYFHCEITLKNESDFKTSWQPQTYTSVHQCAVSYDFRNIALWRECPIRLKLGRYFSRNLIFNLGCVPFLNSKSSCLSACARCVNLAVQLRCWLQSYSVQHAFQ